MKANWFARLYPTLWLARRLLFASTAIILSNLGGELQFAILILSQVVYIFFLCSAFPFESLLESIGEISNEIFVLTALVPLIFVDKENEWTSTTNLGYLGLLLLSDVLFTTFSISKLFDNA